MKIVDQELKTRWTAALRSGEYKKCELTIRDGDCFCALGVLADVAAPNGWKRTDSGGWRNIEFDPYNKCYFTGDFDPWDISDLNDGYRGLNSDNPAIPPKSFEEIADWIEENVPADG